MVVEDIVPTRHSLKTFHGKIVHAPKSLEEKKALLKAKKQEKAAHAANLKGRVRKAKESYPESDVPAHKTAPLVRPPLSKQERSAAARKARKISATKRKAKKLPNRSAAKKVDGEKKVIKKKPTVEKKKPAPTVPRIGRIMNGVLMRMGFREAPKTSQNLRRKKPVPKKPVDKTNRKAKKVLKKQARKAEVAQEVAAHKKTLFKTEASKKVNRDRLKKIREKRRAEIAAKKAPATTKKERKFEFRKADGTAKQFSDKATRIAKKALIEKIRRRHPKVRETYPTTDFPVSTRTPIKKQKQCKLRDSLKPGTVCILLAGVNKGKRVVFLKQLSSGLCLIDGPFCLNRVPMRRISQAFLLATSTRIHMPKLPIKHIDDAYFARQKIAAIKKKDSEEIFDKKKKYYHVSKQRKNDQKKLDFYVLKYINVRSDKKTLRTYLSTKFLLQNHDYPHAMKF